MWCWHIMVRNAAVSPQPQFYQWCCHQPTMECGAQPATTNLTKSKPVETFHPPTNHQLLTISTHKSSFRSMQRLQTFRHPQQISISTFLPLWKWLLECFMLAVARVAVLSSIMIMSPCVSFPFSVPAQSPTELWCNSPVVILLVLPGFSATTLHNQHNLWVFKKVFHPQLHMFLLVALSHYISENKRFSYC